MLFANDIVLSRKNHRELEDDLEKCAGEKRPESEQENDRVFEGWGCGRWRRVEAARRKGTEQKTSNTWVRQLVAMEDVEKK